MWKARSQMDEFLEIMNRRRFLAASGTCLSCAGASGNVVESTVPADASVEVIAFSPVLADWVQHISRPWARKNGPVKVRVGLPSGRLEKHQFTLVPPRSLGSLASGLGKVPASLLGRQEVAWTDVLPVWRDRLAKWRGDTLGVPVQGEIWVQVIRTDWLADDGLQKAHQSATGKTLKVPRLWEEWIELGTALKGKLPGRPGAPVLPPLPSAPEDQLRLLRQVAACHAMERLAAGQKLRPGREAENNHYALDFDLLTGKPKVAGKAFVHALEWMTRMAPLQPKQPENKPWQAFARGESMVALVPGSALSALQRGPLRDRFDIHPLPGADKVFLEDGLLQAGQGNSIPLVGSEGALALAGPEASNEVWDLVGYLVQPKTQLDLVLDPDMGGPVREQHLQGAPWDGMQLDARRLAQWQNALRATLSPAETINPAVALRTPDVEKLDELLARQVAHCLSGKSKPAECLQLAADAWIELGKARPDRLQEVRASAGLT